MTRGEMEDEVRSEIAPHVGDPAARDPIGLRRAVVRAVAEVAERTDCLHKGLLLDLVAGVQRYCPEALRRVTGVAWKDSSSNLWGALPVSTQHQMDKNVHNWRNTPASDYAQALVVTGPNAISVWPTPSVSRAASLRIEGYWKPGEGWVYDAGVLQPAARADTCPLPSFAHTAAVERAKWYFAKSLMVKAPAIAPLLPLLDSQSTRLIGIVESDTANHWQAMGGAPISLWRY
jgi:hypothetical protein